MYNRKVQFPTFNFDDFRNEWINFWFLVRLYLYKVGIKVTVIRVSVFCRLAEVRNYRRG
jgi:hypothetical protein